MNKRRIHEQASGRAMPSSAVISVLALFVAGCGVADGDDFPERSIEMVIPYPAGSGTDTAARMLVEVVNERGELGQDIQIVNREGGGGTVGTTAVLNSDPDGYTLLFTPDGPLTLMPHVEEELAYDVDDLTVIAGVAQQSIAVVVPGNSPFETFDDLIEAASDSPGSVTMGEGPLNYTVPVSMIEDQLGVEFQRVDFDGDGASATALLGDNVDASMMQVIGAMQHLESEDLRALALVSEEASDIVPDVPTSGDVGLDTDWSAFNVIVAPSGLPDDVESTLISEFDEAINSEEFQAAAEAQGLEQFITDPSSVEDELATKRDIAGDLLQ